MQMLSLLQEVICEKRLFRKTRATVPEVKEEGK